MKKRVSLLFIIEILLISLVFYKYHLTQKINLEKTVTKSLVGAKGTYAIAIKNLKTGETYYLSAHKSFQTGSLYKLWIMATAYDEIKNGELTEDEELSEDANILNNKFNISSDSAELTDGAVTLLVASALKQMITISHNYAALLLSERIKLSAVKSFLAKNGFSESVVGEESPTSTAYDIELFLEKLYNGKLINKEYSQKMIDLLKTQQLNNKIPQYLPKGTIVAHKTGELDYFSHDAGIVYTKNGDFIIVILSETDYPPGAEERIARVSQAVYKYLTP